MREVLHTLSYLNRSGCPWEMLPHALLPKRIVYDDVVQWRDDGTWAKLVDVAILYRTHGDKSNRYP
jgi:putative transposase